MVTDLNSLSKYCKVNIADELIKRMNQPDPIWKFIRLAKIQAEKEARKRVLGYQGIWLWD